MSRVRILIASCMASLLIVVGSVATSAPDAQAVSSCFATRSGNTVKAICSTLKYSKARAWADCWPNWRVYGPWVGSNGTSTTSCWTSVERYGVQYRAK